MKQKLYRNGNSVAVTIPKNYLQAMELNDSSEVVVDYDAQAQSIIITPEKKLTKQSTVTPKFLSWLESFNKQYAPAFKELAKK